MKRGFVLTGIGEDNKGMLIGATTRSYKCVEKYYHPNNNKASLVDFDFDGPRLPLVAHICSS